MSMRSAYGTILPARAIETPCIDVCVIDEATQLCTGCRRSLAEIAAWGSLSPTERRSIMSTLAARGIAGDRKVGAE